MIALIYHANHEVYVMNFRFCFLPWDCCTYSEYQTSRHRNSICTSCSEYVAVQYRHNSELKFLEDCSATKVVLFLIQLLRHISWQKERNALHWLSMFLQHFQTRKLFFEELCFYWIYFKTNLIWKKFESLKRFLSFKEFWISFSEKFWSLMRLTRLSSTVTLKFLFCDKK